MTEQAPTKEQCEGQACENTDRHLWPLVSKPDDPYESIHVTKEGNIGINVCGNVMVLPLREWHRRAGGVPGRAIGDEQRPSKDGVSGRTVSVWELPSRPLPPRELKTYTFEELRETFDSGDLVTLLLDEIERLQQCHREGWHHAREVEDEYKRRTGHGFGEQPAHEPGALQAEVDRMRKLFWLAKEDVIFLSGYDEKTDLWPEIDLFYTPCVTVNDTFGYACADAQRLDDSEIDRLIHAHKTWGYDGVVAWASLIRKCEPITPRRTPAYHEARAAMGGAAQPPRDG